MILNVFNVFRFKVKKLLDHIEGSIPARINVVNGSAMLYSGTYVLPVVFLREAS